MDVIGVLYVSLGSRTTLLQNIYVADTHAHVQMLISVVKMATVLEEYTTEEQSSVVRFVWAKGFTAKDMYR
jgi:hypothetical protein